jgi:translocation and assembly module TamB
VTFSGPITKLNVSYRSDPPLAFSDLVALLATGRSPNDATIAARQPTAPAQSWQQMGASALVGQAISNPVAGRLQRFFGVSSLKIDPTISGVTNNPQAKVTLEQQITPDLTFTYITDVANAEEQVIRVEWEFSRTWSAVAMRDENGEFGVDFLYKKRFK